MKLLTASLKAFDYEKQGFSSQVKFWLKISSLLPAGYLNIKYTHLPHTGSSYKTKQ
ncbi:MAG TPA: hypothetical protein PLU49_02275 [Saprospiraceae bacterium]|nr:hypothetical protein [Saprospiraceae bacterium]